MAPKKSADKLKSTSERTDHIGSKLSISSHFPIVGVGASAGGLEAFTQLFKNLPANPGMAFVLVQHLAPEHESMLTQLLSKSTEMPIREVKNGMVVEPDNVYVIPPDKEMLVFQGVLHLSPREKTKMPYMPVDSFLRSLAEDRRNNAMAIILSGTGSDGSMGIRAIKGEGGIVFAQDETAKYDGMPKSAIDTGCVDFIMPTDKIAAELIRISRHPYLAPVRTREAAQILPAEENDLNKIFIMLRTAKGVDFAFYKRSTIMRRVTRRMMLQKIEGIEKYIAHLKENPSEIETLYQDLLINVTSFFREPGAFDALKKSVFPHIVNKAAPDIPVRIWVPACSTGEEAYSIAISLIEYMDDNKISRPVQIFATDLDEAAVEKARKGIYPENISKDISPERLGRFFERTGGGYMISKSIREMCIFAKHNIVKDPPFSRVDLISCRNVLIYFGPDLQKKAIQTFLYALSPKGFLMIGPSEALGEFAGFFSVVDKKNTIYAKKAGQAGSHLEETAVESGKGKAVPGKKVEAQSSGIFDIQKEADTIVLNTFSPAGFVVNDSMKILQFRGDTGPYLRPAPGEASLNLLKMVSEDLVTELRTALHQAKKEDVNVRKEKIRFTHNNRVRYLTIDVVPFKAPSSEERCFLILFEESMIPPRTPGVRAGLKPAPTEEIVQLRQDLADTKRHLRSVTDEYEAANEELRALNEELQSSNEEMQSINEELETAKEELQSTNEELTTVNDELQSRNEEMMHLNNDLVNVLRGIDIPVILLGNELQIRRFNDAAAKMLNLIPSDAGRPISDIRTNISIPDLEQMVFDVINTLAVKEIDVQDVAGRWYSLRIRPYKTMDNRIDGVLMAMVDITDVKNSLLRIKEAYDYANDIVETVWEPLLILDADMRVITANRSFYEKFLVAPEETEGLHLYELGSGRWDIPELRKLLHEVLPVKKSFSDFEVVLEVPNMGRRTMLLNAREIRKEEVSKATAWPWEKEYAGMILLAIEDITERKKIEDAQLFLVQSGWLASGEDFFKSLARYLAENLGMDYVCIDRLQGEGLAAQTMAIYFAGKFEDNVSYTLKDTPCGDVVGKTICCFPEGVRNLYPKDVILQEMLAESYVGTTLWSSGGQPIGLIAIIGRQPLSDPQLAESILKLVSLRAAGELERRQTEVSLEKLNQELQFTASKLDLAYKDMESFSYSVSHDLRAPLRIIDGLSDIVLKDYYDKLDDEGKKLLNSIQGHAKRMDKLVLALLDLSKVGRQEIMIDEIDMEKETALIAADLKEAAPGRNIAMTIKNLPPAHGDIILIRQVLENLLSNAVKFTKARDVAVIEVGSRREDSEEVYYVKDNGAGFNMNYANKLFVVFQRLHSEKEFEGIGIGLSIVQRIVRRHGGRVWAEGRPNEGATFYFSLPEKVG
jgi:two-component system CheB/CheR fusion protein